MGIPRIAHQVWFKFGNGPDTPPAEYDEMRASWKRIHPNWTFMLWNETEARIFLQQYYPEAVDVFDGYSQMILKVDHIRYYLLDHFGGFYLDMDTECKQSLEPLLQNRLVLVRDKQPYLLLNNGFMGAEPHHPFMYQCTQNLKKTRNLPSPFLATGPIFLGVNWMCSRDKDQSVILSVRELHKYFNHEHHATWTSLHKWRMALDPRRRQLMDREDIPLLLRLFIRK